MEVGAENLEIKRAVGLVGVIVAVPDRGNHRAEGLHSFREVRSARVVLVSHHRMRRERRGEHDVVDKAVGGRAGTARLDADDIEPGDFLVAEQPSLAENLIPAADGKHRPVLFHVGGELVFHAHKLRRREFLLTIGATTEKHEVDIAKIDGLTIFDAPHLDGNPAPCKTLAQDAHVTAVAVEIQQVGKHVGDHDGSCPLLIPRGGLRPVNPRPTLRGGLRAQFRSEARTV